MRICFAFCALQLAFIAVSIITKFIIFFALIFLIISAGVFYFILGYSEESLKKQVFEDLTVLAETEEGYIITFLEHIKGRAVDFSSDGLIRDYTEKIVKAKSRPENIINALNIHLRNNKQSVDPTILGILIVDLRGMVIASTDERELDFDESTDEYFKEFSKIDLVYGSAYISDVLMIAHFNAKDPVIMVVAPLFSADKSVKLGYILNEISLSEINKVLSGQKQIELGALTGTRGRRTTLNIYLVNKDNLLITPSIYKNEGLLKQKIDSSLVESCHISKETTGIYKNHLNIEVLGASMCLPMHGWTLITELSSQEAFSLISDLKKEILVLGSALLVILIIIAASFLYYFIIRHILKLGRGAKIIGAGNFDYEIELKSKDEFGDLANDFNIMTRQLKELFNDLKASSLKIKESEEKYKIMFNGAVDAIFISDTDGDFIEVNENAVKMTGYRASELLAMNHLQIYSKENMAKCQEQFRFAMQKGECFSENVAILKKDGQTMSVDIGVSLLRYGNKNFLQFIVRDVSERAALEKHHKEIDHIKSQFINVVSHQLRTPLNSIRWNLEVLLGGDLGSFKKDQEKFLKTVYLNNQNIMNIIADLFLALEIEETEIKLEKEMIDLGVLLDSVAEGFKNSLAIKHIKLSVGKSKKGQIMNVEGDRDKLTQIFSRLIDNAVKYSKDNSEIDIKIEKVNNSTVVSIIDNGIGIPMEEQPALFSKFFRASNAAVMHPNASGLGLFISKKIIEAHHGKIWFVSTEGKGTIFFVSLPASGF